MTMARTNKMRIGMGIMSSSEAMPVEPSSAYLALGELFFDISIELSTRMPMVGLELSYLFK